MYAGPASGVTPIFGPCPPLGQLTGPTTGEPLIPSPTSGSSPASMIPIFTGQPDLYAVEWQVPPEQLMLPPVALIAYTRLLANENCPVAPRAPRLAEVKLPALIPPSSPELVKYSSLVA